PAPSVVPLGDQGTTEGGTMRTVLALGALAAVLTPAAYAVGQARDPRVPQLQRKVAALQTEGAALHAAADQCSTHYVDQHIDHRVLALCRALLATPATLTAMQLANEPAFAFFVNSVVSEGSTTLACPSQP